MVCLFVYAGSIATCKFFGWWVGTVTGPVVAGVVVGFGLRRTSGSDVSTAQSGCGGCGSLLGGAVSGQTMEKSVSTTDVGCGRELELVAGSGLAQFRLLGIDNPNPKTLRVGPVGRVGLREVPVAPEGALRQ